MKKNVIKYGGIYSVASFLGVIIWMGNYDMYVKLILTVFCAGLLLSIIIAKKRKEKIVIFFSAVMLALNFILNVTHGCYLYLAQWGSTYNTQTHFMTIETCYKWNTQHDDMILPLIARNKKVYLMDTNECYLYFQQFSQEVELIKDARILDFERAQKEYVLVGQTTLGRPDYLFTQEFIESLDLHTNHALYISSSKIASAESILVFMDEQYNIYITTTLELEQEFSEVNDL